jgi:hypothetical protein
MTSTIQDIMPKKKVGATDQRATVTLFHDMIHRESECHVDDMMTKSRAREGHPVDLNKLFDRFEITHTVEFQISALMECCPSSY